MDMYVHVHNICIIHIVQYMYNGCHVHVREIAVHLYIHVVLQQRVERLTSVCNNSIIFVKAVCLSLSLSSPTSSFMQYS